MQPHAAATVAAHVRAASGCRPSVCVFDTGLPARACPGGSGRLAMRPLKTGYHSNAHRDARSHRPHATDGTRRMPAPKIKRIATGTQRVFAPAKHAFGPKGPNKVAAAQHVESAGTVARLSKGALGDVVRQLGKGADPAVVSALQAVQDGMGLIEATIDNSAGRTTYKGKDTNGVGGSFVAKRVNSRTMADLKRQVAASGKVAERTSLGDLANVLDNPARLGLVERDTAPPARAASTKAKKTSKARAKGRKAVVGMHTQSGLARGGKAGGKRATCAKRLAAKPWPAPANGVQYANTEVARLLSELPAVYGMKGAYMQAAKDRGFLRDKSFTAYYNDALRHAQDPLRVRDTVGRPPLAATTTLDAAMDAAMAAGGKTSSYAAAEAVLLKSRRAEMNRKGRAGKPTVSNNTVGVARRTCTRARAHAHAHAHACAHACAARALPRARHPHVARAAPQSSGPRPLLWF